MSTQELNDGGLSGVAEISGAEIRARLRDPTLTILNVLALKAFEAGRIPGSLHLPVSEIRSRARSLLPMPSREIAVYCGGGH